MSEPKNTIIQFIVRLLGSIYASLKNRVSSLFGTLFRSNPELELNKPVDTQSNALKQKSFIFTGWTYGRRDYFG